MFNFLKRRRKIKQPSEKKDELVGRWENDLDDGSGLHSIWGFSFRFNEDNTGQYSFWGERKLQDETPFDWQRVNSNSIRIRYRNDDEWTTVNYALTVVNAPYSGKLLKLTDIDYKPDEPGAKSIWGYFGAIFKPL